jgi:hypothetical protein
MNIMLRNFIALSEVLTGVAPLSETLGDAYLKRVQNSPLGGQLVALLDKFEEIVASGGDVIIGVRQHIMGDASLAPLAQQVIILWYLAEIDPRKAPETPDEHFQALLWSVIKAHPPALSGGYFGYWKYPPEN